MTQMHCFGGGAPACVQVEWLLIFIGIQNLIHISVGEEDAPAQEAVRSLASGSLYSVYQLFVNFAASKLNNELVIVDAFCTACPHRPWIHKILAGFCGIRVTISPSCWVPRRAASLVLLPHGGLIAHF